MNRIDKTFKKFKEDKTKAFIPYITAGDPDLKTSEKIICALHKSGADIIELGIPFSDPLADGPTIQKAMKRSLDNGCTIRKIMTMVKRLRHTVDVPFVFMTYYNIVFNYGVKKFIADSKKAGVDGIIVPDLPMEESEDLLNICDRENFSLIMLTAPTTSIKRFRKIASSSRGFIYYVSLTGVTGARKQLSDKLKKVVKGLKKTTKKPVCVGFGISDPKQAKMVASSADGVIVGSAIIKIIEKNLHTKTGIIQEISKFAKRIAKAVHSI